MAKVGINIEALAKQCGVKIVTTKEKGWGGKYGFTYQNSCLRQMGFRTKASALKGWFMGEFSTDLGKILLRDYLKIETK